jgi:transaldolase
MGQSLWLDNITRGLLTSGTLRRYIQELSVTGLTSNLTMECSVRRRPDK